MMTTNEAYRILEPAHFLKDNEITLPDSIKSLETNRRIIDFVHEIDTARFMLAMSFKQVNIDPYLDLFEEKDFGNEFKHNYYRQHYLYSAVIWYHNCFDLILQSLWFFYELHGEGQITNSNYNDIISKCGYSKIISKLSNYPDIKESIKQFHEENEIVLDLGNMLKHRQFIENSSYLLYHEGYIIKNEDYNSNKTKFTINLDTLQSILVDYHMKIVTIAKELLLPINDNIKDLDCGYPNSQ